MAFFSAVAALALEHFRPQREPFVFYRWYAEYTRFVETRFNAGGINPGGVGWAFAVLPLLFAAWAVYAIADSVSPLLGWVWNVAVLYATLGFRYYSLNAEAIASHLRTGDAAGASALLARWRNGLADDPLSETDCARLTVEQTLTASHRQLFGPLLWFAVLSGFGPVGAVLYRASSILARRWEGAPGLFGAFATRAFYVLNWLPARATAMSFAVAGNFEDATYAWRTQAGFWPDIEDSVVLAAGAGAMGASLGGNVTVAQTEITRPVLGQGQDADADLIDSALGLVWRALTIWLVIAGLFVVGGWAA
jgi:adenosylcobinamide-phosphate synthase